MQASLDLEREFWLRSFLTENKGTEGLLHYDPKVVDPVLWVTAYPIVLFLK